MQCQFQPAPPPFMQSQFQPIRFQSRSSTRSNMQLSIFLYTIPTMRDKDRDFRQSRAGRGRSKWTQPNESNCKQSSILFIGVRCLDNRKSCSDRPVLMCAWYKHSNRSNIAQIDDNQSSLLCSSECTFCRCHWPVTWVNVGGRADVGSIDYS